MQLKFTYAMKTSSVSVTGELEVQIHEPLSSPTEPEFLGYNTRNGFSHKGLIISYNK